jgi:cytochrome c oxidase subunit 2
LIEPVEDPMSITPGKRPASDALVAGIVVVLLIALVAAVFLSGLGSTLYPPQAATVEGRDTRGLYDIVFAFAVAIFLVVEGLIVWSVIRYRRRKTDTELPVQTHGNNLLEIVWTVVPTAIVLFLFVISWQTLNTVNATTSTPDVKIRAVASQFQWTFQYLDASGNKLFTQSVPTAEAGGGMAVPVGEKIQVELQAADVIHAFYVPRFLFKRDAIPGQTNVFDFTVDPAEAGGPPITGHCAELCGIGHYAMLFDVVPLSRADYDAWLAQKIAEANATPTPAPSAATTLQLTAKNVQYETTSFEVAAGQPFALEFKNDDPAAIAHDADLHGADGAVIVDTPTIDGGQSTTYTYQALDAGTYTFICSVHPTMQATLTVK